MKTFLIHNQKPVLKTLSRDKSFAEPRCEKNLVRRTLVEVGFPPLRRDSVRRELKVGTATEKPTTLVFTPDSSAVMLLLPMDEACRAEFTTFDVDGNGATVDVEFCTRIRKTVTIESSPLTINLLGEVEVSMDSPVVVQGEMPEPPHHESHTAVPPTKHDGHAKPLAPAPHSSATVPAGEKTGELVKPSPAPTPAPLSGKPAAAHK